MLLFTAALLTVAALVFTVAVRSKDLPEPEPVSPVKHLEERKATIYENLRDLQFEYRLGKLSDADYQQTKQDLQRELAAVLAEIEAGEKRSPRAASLRPAAAAPAPAPGTVCPHCAARFPSPLKFCGECGKPMAVETR